MLQIPEETTCEIVEFLRAPILKNICKQLLLSKAVKWTLQSLVFLQRILGKNGLNVPEKIKLQTRWYSIAGQGTKMNYLMKRTWG